METLFTIANPSVEDAGFIFVVDFWPTHTSARSDSHRHDRVRMDAGARMDQRAVAFAQIGYRQDSAPLASGSAGA